MKSRTGGCAFLLALFFAMASMTAPHARAQQTLGGITGTVTDSSGALVADATVTLVGDQTKLTRSQNTNANGGYLFVNLPIGSYTLTFTHAGFQTQTVPAILVQANRTVSLNAELKVGNVSESITVEETPLLNVVDTTNGYVMDKLEIDSVPLPTGSFTGLALLSPGVNAELSSGTGANAGLGNSPVWANGQRDTSNAYLLNGVNAYSLFNGKSTSQVASARVVNNTGIGSISAVSSIPVQSSASIYLAIGESIPSPAPESIQEVRVNTSMYDAQQGSNSGAHIDMSTASGTNNIHGSSYVHRGTNWLNADPYFYNADPNIPAAEKNPELHRYTAGGTIGLPIKKDRLFFYGSYQYTHASDQEIGISRAFVPLTLTDTNRQDPTQLANAANNDSAFFGGNVSVPGVIGTAAGDVNPIVYALLNYPGLNGQKFLVPSANQNSVVNQVFNNPAAFGSAQYGLEEAFPEDAEVPGTALFVAHQGVADLDWNPNSTHSFSAKYYYQHDPTTAPYAYSMIQGFDQHLDAGSQVVSLSHTQIVKSNLSITEIFGFIREKAYSTISQPFSTTSFQQAALQMPAIALAIQKGQITANDLLIHNLSGSTLFPAISMVFVAPVFLSYPYSMNIGAGAFSQGAFTGVFQNRFNPSANAIWTLGKHTITFGGSFDYSQLNTKDARNQLGTINAFDFTNFVEGQLVDNFLYGTTSTITGNANRYWRANETGEFFQDKYQVRTNLTVTAGLRFDWDGGLTEKNGNLLNFDPSSYNYNPTADTLSGNGLIIAGNNPKYATPGVSKTTLTGRQWGFAPRIGVAWSPKMFKSKVVVRAGWGIYYDRGEVYAYLSPGLTQNITNGGPFGINQQQPFVNTQFCPGAVGPSIPCVGTGSSTNQLAYPWGLPPGTQPTGNPATVIPTTALASGLANGAPPFYLGAYARNNKLPYTMNSSLDIQWQPRNDLAIDIGYVGGLGRHEVIPIPFNQARQASLNNPLCGTAAICPNMGAGASFAQFNTYGYTVKGLTVGGQPMLLNSEGGNVDLRVPYIGYGAESEIYTAEGISAYNALQAHVGKRLSHGLQAGVSYTFSRSMDEQSALGLFYNGNNPLNIRDGYGPSDFDRTHVFNVDFHYELPKFFSTASWEGKAADGWGIQGIVTIQSGQPYSVIDYSGAVGSTFYSVYDGITNPILPLASGCTPQQALTGNTGNNINAPALKASCFQIPILAPQPGGNVACAGTPANTPVNGVPCGDTFETKFAQGQRNIFRQARQRRADVSVVKVTQLSDRFSLKYSFDVYNLTNTPSFDIPIDNVTQNAVLSPTPNLGEDPLPNSCPGPTNTSFYSCPIGLGQVTKTIGSSRQIQMSLSLSF
jgi:hypothetical protein